MAIVVFINILAALATVVAVIGCRRRYRRYSFFVSEGRRPRNDISGLSNSSCLLLLSCTLRVSPVQSFMSSLNRLLVSSQSSASCAV